MNQADIAPIEEARNLGPTSGAELRSVGIDTLGKLLKLGWEEVFDRWVSAYPNRLNLNALTALIGAVEDCDWRQIPTPLKYEAKVFLKSYRGQVR